MPVTDLLRLLAVPVFAWAAWRDYRTRRVPSRVWYPLVALGVGLLLWDGLAALDSAFETRLFLVRVAISVGFVVPVAWAFWWFGLFGGADRKAFVALAILFPAYPTYAVAGTVLPRHVTTLGVFSLTILTDGVILGIAYPLATAAGNALRGRLSPVMLIGRPVTWTDLPTTHGKLLEAPSGITLSGLDLDALRMYLRWRGITLADVRRRADHLRDPATLPADPNPPTDGAVDCGERPDRPAEPRADGGGYDDPWGAAAFLDAIEGSAYGTTPERLRDGLDLLAERDAVWVSPGIPFLVPVFAGLLLALTYGDVLFVALSALGLFP